MGFCPWKRHFLIFVGRALRMSQRLLLLSGLKEEERLIVEVFHVAEGGRAVVGLLEGYIHIVGPVCLLFNF